MSNIFFKIEKKCYEFIDRLENIKISFSNWILTIVCLSVVRSFLEIFSTGREFIIGNVVRFSTISGFLMLALVYILFVHFITKVKIEKISRASLFLMVFIIFPPIIDLIVTQGKGAYVSLSFAFPQTINGFTDIFSMFKNIIFDSPLGIFFNNYKAIAYKNNFGIGLEMNTIILFVLFYVFLKTKSIFKVLLSFLLLYPIIFLFNYAFWPFGVINLLGLRITSNYHFIQIAASAWLSVFILAGALWYYIYSKEKFIALVKNLRFFRITLYLSALFYGIYLVNPYFSFNFFDWLKIIMAVLAVTFSWLVAVGSNDLADEEADKISSPHRPLPSGLFTREEIKLLNIVFRITSYICAFLAGSLFLLFIIVRSCLAYIYSNPPLKLKRIPLLATFIIAVAVILGVMGGYSMFAENIYNFPSKLIVLLAISITLLFNVIDIKDYKGDKKSKVYTLLVIFGLKKGKIIVSILAVMGFFIAPLMYSGCFWFLFAFSLTSSVLCFYLINKKNYQEKWVLCVYAAYLYITALMLY